MTNHFYLSNFHNSSTEVHLATTTTQTQFAFNFENFFHPYLGELIKTLNQGMLKDMLDPAFLTSLSENFFAQAYQVLSTPTLDVAYHPKAIDLNPGAPYANYNAELLLHLPLAIATHLSQNQRFAEAQRWFHFIFDPTSTENAPAPKRFWKYLGFRTSTKLESIESLLELLSTPDADLDPDSEELRLKRAVSQGYAAIRNHPFQAFPVARTRPGAFQLHVVMKYLDNLLAWGDSLFMQDTAEAIGDATLRYVMAANILGLRPQQMPVCGNRRPKCFADLAFDEMGNAMVDMETQLPFNGGVSQAASNPLGPQTGGAFGIGRALYFCVPHNRELLSYWDKVEAQIFKIHNCMNIEGVVRPLPLFDPPANAHMLVKAAAAGISIGAILGGANAPASPHRSQVLIQKALELCGEVRALGAALLSAIEKQEGEALALLRQGHEIKIQQLSQDIRFLQWKQAEEGTQALLRTRASAMERYAFYLRLLGEAPDEASAPAQLPLDRRELTEENFDEAYGDLVGQYERAVPVQAYPGLKLSGEGAPALLAGSSGGNLYMTRNENLELNVLMPLARDTRLTASVTDIVASTLTFIPDVSVDLHYWGLGMHSVIFGGSKLANAVRIQADVMRTVSAYAQDQAGMAARAAGYERRADEWRNQANLAARELMQIGRQILGSLIAEQVAHREYVSAKKQIENAQEVDTFLHAKFTNADLYGWMQGALAKLYYEYYRFAVEVGRKAEAAMKRELMRPELDDRTFVQVNYWDGGRKGLLAGEALHLDIKRMEMAYHDYNKREFQIARNVSLRQIAPVALLELKKTGRCTVSIPEWLFDQDCPGHYMRRLNSVALSIPSVVGSYASLNCTLTLLNSSIRVSPLLSGGVYGRTGADDSRFVDYFGSVQSIVTSTGVNDSGLFETNLRDEKLLPFEGAGAISTWSLSLPANFRTFDYATISDVILHLRYTARQGGDVLGQPAINELALRIADENASGLFFFLSLKHDFPTEWAAFFNTPLATIFQCTLPREAFPYITRGRVIGITPGSAKLFQIASGTTTAPAISATASATGIDFTITFVPAAAAQLRQLGSDAQLFVVLPYGLT